MVENLLFSPNSTISEKEMEIFIRIFIKADSREV